MSLPAGPPSLCHPVPCVRGSKRSPPWRLLPRSLFSGSQEEQRARDLEKREKQMFALFKQEFAIPKQRRWVWAAACWARVLGVLH